MAGTTPRPDAAQSERPTAVLRRLAADFTSLLRIRLEIFGLEAQEQAQRWAVLFLVGWAAVQLMCFGLLFLALTAVVAWWDTHRVLALGIAVAVFVGAAIALGVWAVQAWRNAPAPFPVTRGELETDAQCLDDRGAGA